MRLFSLLLALSFIKPAVWETDFLIAKQRAEQEHKYILLNFSGSDWCGPCIRMEHEIFESDFFLAYANDSLVLLNADFPRLKKNKLPKDLQKKNDLLADTYDPMGSFPYTLLLDASGKTIYTWDGLPSLSPDQFVKKIKEIINDRH